MGPRRRLASLAAVAGLALVAVLLFGGLSTDELRARVDQTGAWAPITYVVLCALLTCAFFPGPVMVAAAGVLFGTAAGFGLALTFVVVGATLACAIGRIWAFDAAAQLAGPRTAPLRDWVGQRGFLAILLLRLVPGLPYTVINYAAGLTPIRYVSFAAGTAVGSAPRTFAYVALGGSLGDLTSPEALVAVALLVVLGISGTWIAARDHGLRAAATALRAPAAPAPGTGSSSPDDRSAARR